jgi:hypothetical protein
MAGVSIRFKMNEQEFRRMQQSGTISRAVERAAGTVRDGAKRELTGQGRIDTGLLRQSIVTRRVSSSRGVFYEVGSPLEYAIYQHEGTKAHGPRHARYLRFKPKGGGDFIFAKFVRGVRPSKFLTKALARLTVNDFRT